VVKGPRYKGKKRRQGRRRRTLRGEKISRGVKSNGKGWISLKTSPQRQATTEGIPAEKKKRKKGRKIKDPCPAGKKERDLILKEGKKEN